MKALSLKQPWEWAVRTVGVDKNIENRSWWSAYRGPVWIAASAQVTRRYYEEASEMIAQLCGCRPPPLSELPLGAITCRVDIVDCIAPGGRVCHVSNGRLDLGNVHHDKEHPLHPAKWHFSDQFGYVLENRVTLAQPVACKGLQRFWNVPEGVMQSAGGRRPSRWCLQRFWNVPEGVMAQLREVSA